MLLSQPGGHVLGRADGRVWAAEGLACYAPPATFVGSLPADGFAFREKLTSAEAINPAGCTRDATATAASLGTARAGPPVSPVIAALSGSGAQ